MRTIILFIALILNYHVGSVSICEICECQHKSGLIEQISVNCSFSENVLENEVVMPNQAILLDLSRSNLTKILPKFLQSKTLEELLLNKNKIKEINLKAFQLPELRRLDLSDNELEILNPEIFKGITKLEYLNLANNKFTAKSQLNFSLLVNLKEIIFDNNDIGSDVAARNLFFDDGFGLPIKLRHLSISGINLKDFESYYLIPVYNSLKKLVVSNNNLTGIAKLPRFIEYVDYSNNPIKNLTKYSFIDHMGVFSMLKLNNLEIEEIPEYVFSRLIILTLEMKDNKNLKEFSNLAFGEITKNYFSIRNLTLKGSSLKTLHKSLSVFFRLVKRLDLQHNPWVCDCNLAWFRNLRIDQDLTEDLRCASPPYLLDRKIFELDEKDFCPKPWWEGSPVGITIALVLFTALIFVTLIWIFVFTYVANPSGNKQVNYVHQK